MCNVRRDGEYSTSLHSVRERSSLTVLCTHRLLHRQHPLRCVWHRDLLGFHQAQSAAIAEPAPEGLATEQWVLSPDYVLDNAI